jgi:hypothetical protein
MFKDKNKVLVYSVLYTNSSIALLERISQITYLATTNFIHETVRNTCIAFLIILLISNILMMTLFSLTNVDNRQTTKQKLGNYFCYILSADICYSVGVQRSLATIFDIDQSIVVTMKVLNILHVLFISLPQILIVTIHSSAVGYFVGVDIFALFFSSFFILFSIVFLILCIKTDTLFDDYLFDMNISP